MKVNGVKLSKDLHFFVPPILAKAIDDLVSAIERDDIELFMYMDDVEGFARMVDEDYDNWIRAYYLEGGWKKDVVG